MRVLVAHNVQGFGGEQLWPSILWQGLTAAGHVCDWFLLRPGKCATAPPERATVHEGTLADLVELVAVGGYDVIHASGTDWDRGLSLVQRLVPSARLVLTLHGMVTPGWMAENCAALVGCARWVAAAQQRFTDLPVQRVYNGVNTEQFCPPAGPLADGGAPIVGWSGRAGALAQKRIDLLAAAAPALAAAGLRIHIASPDPPSALPAQVRAQLEPFVERWDSLPREAMPEFYQTVAASGGLLLSTSAWEGLPLSLLEGQACGCPAMGPQVCGVDEVLDPAEGGLLYPPDLPPNALAERVTAAVSDTAAQRRRGAAAAGRVRRRFRRERMIRGYLRVYEAAPYAPWRPRPAVPGWQPLAPLIDYDRYVDGRWMAGSQILSAASDLAARGRAAAARTAALEALRTCPTLFVRARRAALLARVLLRPSSRPALGEAAP